MEYIVVTDTNIGLSQECFRSQFTVNNQIILPDSNYHYCGLELDVDDIEITHLHGITYIIIPSRIPYCNGSFCSIKIDYLFQLKDGKIWYDLVGSRRYMPSIYGDLNHDGQMDIIDFGGSLTEQQKKHTNPENEHLHFSAQLLTLKNHQWIPLKDKNNKAYYIFFSADDVYEQDTYKILDYYWPMK